MTRDNIVWGTGTAAAVLAYIVAHTSLIPPAYVEQVKDVSLVLSFVFGLLTQSPLPHSQNVAAPAFDWKKLFGK